MDLLLGGFRQFSHYFSLGMSAYDKDDDKFFEVIKGLMTMPETEQTKIIAKSLLAYQERKLVSEQIKLIIEQQKLERIKLTVSQGR